MIIIAFLVKILNLLIKGLGQVANVALMLLPKSPFKSFQTLQLPFIDTLNWVIPIPLFISILTAWVGAIAIYYIIQVVLRWVKIIE